MLADLGSAVQLAFADATATMRIGTPGYFSPEIMQARPYNTKTDIFGLGSLMYTLITGSHPFFSTNQQSYSHRILHEELNLESDINTARLSPHAKDILARMLERDPAARLSVNQLLSHPWLV